MADSGALATDDQEFTVHADGGGRRHYSVRVSKGHDGKKPLAVAMRLHGGDGRSRGAALDCIRWGEHSVPPLLADPRWHGGFAPPVTKRRR